MNNTVEEKNVLDELWSSYKSVVIHSIVTSFGLDFLVHDQVGGDVDTIHNVREQGYFKNPNNQESYDNRGAYSSKAYHDEPYYKRVVKKARDSNEMMEDSYVPGNKIFYGKASSLGTERKANLDHVISAKEIHDDPARILSGKEGPELANTDTNLKFTNEKLNKSMGDKSIDEYIQYREDKGDPLPEEQVDQMRKADSDARKAYNKTLARDYYLSDKFFADAGAAALKRGLEMSLRQAIGFVFLQIWCACEDELRRVDPGSSVGDCVKAVAKGIPIGLNNVKTNYKDLFKNIEQGFGAGALASLTTTIINVFFTTDVYTVRYIRQIYVIVVQTADILIINPDDLPLGDQLTQATVSIATGASVLVGTAVANAVAETPIGMHGQIGIIVQNFSASLVCGLMSCTLLVLLDRSKFINDLKDKLNIYRSESCDTRIKAEEFSRLAAEIANYDIDSFVKLVNTYDSLISGICKADDEQMDQMLSEAIQNMDISVPWTGDLDDFLSDKNNNLVFET